VNTARRVGEDQLDEERHAQAALLFFASSSSPIVRFLPLLVSTLGSSAFAYGSAFPPGTGTSSKIASKSDTTMCLSREARAQQNAGR
jgi:hypothetical protein